MFIDYFNSPIGLIEIRASDKGITQLVFVEQKTEKTVHNAIIQQCIKQLAEYFNQKRTTFDLPLDQQGTPFQKQTWTALLDIPFGKTATYRDIAIAVKNPKAVRAVGAANGKNPISIIVPCHRIIGSNGKLTGYAGGLERKEWLLKFEGVLGDG